MKYEYTHFILENIAPKGATMIVVMETDVDGTPIREVCSIPESQFRSLTPPAGEPLYSFGLVSDIHLWSSEPAWKANSKFDTALSFFEAEGCDFCVVCGDLTQTGFYKREVETQQGTEYLDTAQMDKYVEILAAHPNLPVYEIAGNHESYYSMAISDNMGLWEEYTGRDTLSYTVQRGNDIFVFLGEPNQSDPITVEGKTMLQGLLDDPANADKRFLVFVHSYLEEDSGDPYDYRENSIFEKTSNSELTRAAFIDLLAGRGNVILVHGHSHMKFEHQIGWPDANYTDVNGFVSVHVPSLSRPRNVNHEGTTQDTLTPYDNEGGEGYVVEMYENCVVLRGFSFDDSIAPAWSTIAQYMIDVATTICGLMTADGYALMDSTGAQLLPKEDN